MGVSTVCVHFVVCALIICSFSGCYAKKPGRLRSIKSEWKNDTLVGGDRSGKSIGLPFMAYVKFPQDQCKSDAGDMGVCIKRSACTLASGVESGSCAFGYGTCCIITQKCSEDISTVRINGTRLTQGSTYVESCRYEIPKQNNVCQIRLDFTQFSISEDPNTPFTGDCMADTLTISGNANSILGPLCGNLDGQHMYLNYGANDKINLDIFLLSSMMQQWNIMVTMIKCDSQSLAPPGCLQYYTNQRGMVKSLNYNLQHQLNNQDYSVCVRANQGMKKITWKMCDSTNAYDFFVSENIALDASGKPQGQSISGSDCNKDWVMIFGADKYCGSGFPDSVAVMTQPFILQVHMNEWELPPPTNPCIPPPVPPASCPGGPFPDDSNTGFCLAYAQTPY